MAYTFEQLLAADPSNPSNIAQNGSITIFAPGDPTMTPLTITDPDGSPLPNPFTVNANGFGPAFAHATLDRVAWSGGGFTGFVTSYEGMKEEAVAARAAAESAAATAGAEATAVAEAAIAGATDEATAAKAAAETAASNASASATAAANSAALVGAPADSAIAAAVSNSASATKAALNATYATTAAVAGKLDASAAKTTYARRLGGSRTIVIGDSIDAALNGWFEYLCILSNQKVTRQRNAGIGGQTTTQFLARIQADVIAHAPDICIIGGATNDHSQGITEATTRANYQAMVDALLAAGIKPVVRNCPPTDVAGSSAPWNTVALRRNAVQRHNAWLRQWATGQGIPVLDVYTPLVDPATGGLRAAIAGDGIHPTEQGNKDMAAGIIAAGLPSLFAGSVNIGTSKGEDSNLLGYGNNGVFIGDANADGVADGWNVSGATVKSIAAAVSPAIGNVQHLEGDGTATTTIYQEDQSPATRASHVVSASGRIKINTGKVRVRFEITGGSIDLGPFALPLEGIFYAEGTAPANVTRIRLNVYSDTGTAANFDVSQMAIRDRTALAT